MAHEYIFAKTEVGCAWGCQERKYGFEHEIISHELIKLDQLMQNFYAYSLYIAET